MRLILIRHGDPNYTIDSLTEKGWREAKALAQRVGKWDITQVYVSPLGRANDTASESLKVLKKDAIMLPWLREFIVHVKDPVTQEERIPWDFMPDYWTKEPLLYDKEKWTKAPIMSTGKIEEGFAEVQEGLDALLKEYGYIRNGEVYQVTEDANREATVVCFCHLGLIMTILSHLLGIAQPLLTHGFFLAPTSVTTLAVEERTPGTGYFRVQMMGDTSHLREIGEPVSKAGYFVDPFQY